MPESLTPKQRSLRALDWINFCMADIQTGVGPFVAIYLTVVRHWNPGKVGLVVAAQSIAMVVAQAPAGALVDWSSCKKCIGAVAAVFTALGAVGITAAHSWKLEFIVQMLIGGAGTVFAPLIAALSLGMVGRAALGARVGRNEAFNHAGNVVFALLAGLLGAYIGQQWIFYLTAIVSCATVAICLLIRNRDVDNQLARAAIGSSEDKRQPKGILETLGDRRILIFAASVVIFHFANAAMLPMVGEVLSRGKGQASSLFMSACIIIAQVVMIPVALIASRLTDRIGRKPLFLVGFGVLSTRGALFALNGNPLYLIGVQSLDGVGAAIFGVLWVLIISDLAVGTGRFNILQGSIIAAWNLGAFFSNFVAGWLAKVAGYRITFLSLGALAALGFVFFAVFMPETRNPLTPKCEDVSSVGGTTVA